MMRRFVCSLALAVSLVSGAGRAQEATESPPPNVVTLRPAASPVPALRYSLLPKAGERLPGNAALFYHRAIIQMMSAERGRAYRDQYSGKSVKESNAEQETRWNWLNAPLDSIPREAVRKHLQEFASSLHEVELGAKREYCDWELQHRDEGFELLLEELQEMRAVNRILILKIRLELLEGRIESALHWLQTHSAMARHVNQGHSLIATLITAAFTNWQAELLEELIQAPGAPNLYWALASLPQPLIDLRPGMEGEKLLLEKEFPQLRTIDSAPWSIEQARVYSDDFQKKMGMLTGDLPATSSSSTQPSMRDLGSHLMFTALIARDYPAAKRYLIAQGRSAAQVEAMPAIQVVAIHSYGLYKEARDDIFKWYTLPYWQGYKGMADAQDHPRAGWTKLKEGIPFATVLPAVRGAYSAPARIGRRFALVQTIEAIRLYAAGHHGTLPPSLEAITEAPVPIDPSTGKLLPYTVDGMTARIIAPPPSGYEQVPELKINYELKLAR
jgi:hypothetical protein